MHYVYVLQRKSNSDEVYIGLTNNLERRFEEHQKIKDSHTGERGSWRLVYYEAYLSEADARDREHKLKQYGSSWGHLKNRIANSLAIES